MYYIIYNKYSVLLYHDLGFQLTEYTDLADRMIFLNHGKLVYIAGWWYDPENPKGITIDSPNNIFKTNRSRVKFRIKKKGDVFVFSRIYDEVVLTFTPKDHCIW